MTDTTMHSAITDHPVLDAGVLGTMHLSNRAVVAPMSRVSTRGDGVPTARMQRYYAGFADGGFSLIITEGVYPDRSASQAYSRQPGITTSDQVAAWESIADRVHEWDTRIIMQLMHAGALVQQNPRVETGIAPSAVPPKGEKMPEYGGNGPYPTPREMKLEDFDAVCASFARAARRACDAGMDGVEIHGANGYLLDQFITTYTNQREDRYGGDPERRIRFPVRVVRAVRDAVPEDFVVGYRLSQTKVNDFDYRWPGGEQEATTYYTALNDAGVDYLHIASEGRNWVETARLDQGTTLTKRAREVTGLPVIANGGMHDPEQARRVLSEGHADFLSLARGALANRDWPKRIANEQQIREFDPGVLDPSAMLSDTEKWGGSGE